ncbi:hypothetical protein QR680_014882 [Steinernema hermaphroditum]|uniref:Uncharacterized protein n=1 Tax=Steinernema hermaphroditum TaxID=289476 RepID=A0AA39ICL0_9BILA|nr:hypothetical protein QR680_014882 [Steinernema hermaphroditum]
MRKFEHGCKTGENFPCYDSSSTSLVLSSIVESWTVDQVVLWMRGLDDGVLAFLDRIEGSCIDGRALFLVDCDDLERIGIKSYGCRKIIFQAIKVLYHFCYTIKTENLQTLAMTVCVSARETMNDMKATKLQYEKLRNKSPTKSDLIVVFNSITKAVSRINEDVKKLMFWLDRSPFDRKEKFIELRNRLIIMACDIAKCVNVPSRELIQTPSLLLKKAEALRFLCQTIIDLEDPAILYTSFLKKAILKKTTSSEWGFNLQSSYRGVHVISEIKLQTPADLCGKIDAGDEIVAVNGVTVIGWELSKLVQKIYDSPMEMVLIINKRPCEFVANPFRGGIYAPPPNTTAKTLRLAPGSTLTRLGSTKPNPGNLTAKADFSFFSGNDFIEEFNRPPKMLRRTSSLTIIPTHVDGNQSNATHAPGKQTSLILRRSSLYGDRARKGRIGSTDRTRNGRNVREPRAVKFDDVVADFHVLYPPKLSFRRSIIRTNSKKRDSDKTPIIPIIVRQHASLDETIPPTVEDENEENEEEEEDEDSTAQPPLIVRRTRRMRQQPDGYVKSFIDNRLVDEIEENAVENTVDKTEGEDQVQYATIEVVPDEELEKLGIIVQPTTPLSGGGFRSRLPSDWKAPIRELVTATAGFIGTKNPHNSLTSLESPMCLSSHSKVTRFFAEPSLPSSSSSPPPTPLKSPFAMTSSIISEDVSLSSCSTNRTKPERRAPLANTEETLNIDDWTTASNTDDENTNRRIRSTVSAPPEDSENRGLSLQELSLISCELLGGKCYEGWIRRMRMEKEREKSKKRKWVKCWMVLKSSLLFIYQNQFAKEADVVLAIVNFSVNDATDIKTSKKHVFKLHRGSTAFYFAASSSSDMKSWMNKLALAAICYNQSDEKKKSSDTMSKSAILYVNNHCDASVPPSPGSVLHHTLPRANNVVSTGLRGARHSERQGSLTSLHSARSALDSELLQALETSLARKRKEAERRESIRKK